MPQTRILLSVLCVAAALVLVLLRPLPSRADDTPIPAAPPAPSPAEATPIVPPLPVIRQRLKSKAKPRHRRRPQVHIPFGTRVVDYARHFIGIRYAWGGSSPGSGFDCSGLVRYVYAHFGVSLAHSSYAQFGRGFGVRRNRLRPGDLVFFDHLGHVGIYAGNGRFIHAPHTGARVRMQSLSGWYSYEFVGARRLQPD